MGLGDALHRNSTDKTVIANNAVNLGVLPEEQINNYAGSAQFDFRPPDSDTWFLYRQL